MRGEMATIILVFDVQVALPSGTTFLIKDCREDLTIRMLKKKIAKVTQIWHGHQHLLLGTTLLEDDQLLLEAGVDGKTILTVY